MSDTPFMPLWVADFVGDTLDLDAKEIGAYLLILMTMWGRDGYLPSDEKKLQRVARCGRDWPRIWASLSHYFTVDGDRVTQARLLLELQKVAAKREVSAQRGALGGKAKALKSNGPALANAKAQLQQPEPEPEDIGKPISRGRDRFEDFWAVVPRRIAKEAARRAFAEAVKLADPDAIIAAMRRYAENRRGQDAQFTAHPSTWLNAGRWADEDQTHSAPANVDKMAAWEAAIKSGKDYLCRNIPGSAARALVDAGRVTAEQCKAAGVAL